MNLFIDMWGWVALYNRREARHEKVKEIYHIARRATGQIVTTDYVLDETFTLLFKRVPFERAETFVQHVDEAIHTGFLQLEWVGPDRFEEAQSLRSTYRDKPDISFTDLTSMAVMQELELTRVLSGDAHFEQVGLGFQRVP